MVAVLRSWTLLVTSVYWWWIAGIHAQDDGWGGGSDTGYTMPPGVILFDGQRFEYIVVGAGAAGAAVAARLALAGHDVLLVEAGGDPDLLTKIPAAAQGLMGGPIDWQYQTLPNNVSCLAFRNKQCRFSRGRCLGGSTSMNFMIHTRGTPSDFDDLGIPDWTWKDIEPFFLRFEGLKDLDKLPPSSVPYHNTNGTVRMKFFEDPQNPWHSRMVEGYQSLNIPFNPDPNAESIIGVTKVIGYVYENERMSSARGYLGRNDVKRNLKVAKFTTCTGVIIGDDNIALGITVVHGLFRRKLRLYANREVILSAGAIGTPHILMLSGIGHAEHLRQFNIPIRADLPVGDEMTDHVLPLVFVQVDKGASIFQNLLNLGGKAIQLADLLLLKSGPLTSNGLTDICTFLNTECYDFEARRLSSDRPQCRLPTLQMIHAYVDKGLVWVGAPLFQQATDLDDAVTAQLKALSKEYAFIVMSPLLLQPHSRGSVRLASADPLAPPAIDPNYLSDERDLAEMVRALRIVEQLMETPAFRAQNATLVRLRLDGCPPPEAAAYWPCYCRHLTHSTFHATGTAALGRVLDARLRVRGVRRLRVADLSALPRLTRGNTASAALALGERLAHFLLNGD